MTVDVVWDGVALAKSATAREENGGWFVELEQPMPVGTNVVLTGDVQATVEVVTVHEGIGSGMLLKTAASRQSVAGSAATESDSSGEKSDSGGEKKEKRKKKR